MVVTNALAYQIAVLGTTVKSVTLVFFNLSFRLKRNRELVLAPPGTNGSAKHTSLKYCCFGYNQGDQKIWKKNCPNLEKRSQNNCQTKKILIKYQLESPNLLHQTPSKLLKYLQQTIFSEKNILGL
jgi:hypothetical protein